MVAATINSCCLIGFVAVVVIVMLARFIGQRRTDARKLAIKQNVHNKHIIIKSSVANEQYSIRCHCVDTRTHDVDDEQRVRLSVADVNSYSLFPGQACRKNLETLLTFLRG
jgi:hypothetical protein